MTQTGSIRGVVRSADNRPLGDVAVMIASGPNHRDIAALTGPDGSFGFSQLRPGRYAIEARGSQATSGPIDLDVRRSKVTFVEIWLETEIVEDTDGTDVEDLEAEAGAGDPSEPEDLVGEI